MTYSAGLVSEKLYDLDDQHGLFKHISGYFTSFRGQGEKYVQGLLAPSTWYFIMPNGDFYEWLGPLDTNTLDLSSHNLLGSLGLSVYANPELLHEAFESAGGVPPVALPVALSVVGDQLTIDPELGFAGTFDVMARVTDAGGLFAEQTFTVTVTAPPPANTILAASQTVISTTDGSSTDISLGGESASIETADWQSVGAAFNYLVGRATGSLSRTILLEPPGVAPAISARSRGSNGGGGVTTSDIRARAIAEVLEEIGEQEWEVAFSDELDLIRSDGSLDYFDDILSEDLLEALAISHRPRRVGP